MTPPTPAWYSKGCCPGSLVLLFAVLSQRLERSRRRACVSQCAAGCENLPELLARLLHDAGGMHGHGRALGHSLAASRLNQLVCRFYPGQCLHFHLLP